LAQLPRSDSRVQFSAPETSVFLFAPGTAFRQSQPEA